MRSPRGGAASAGEAPARDAWKVSGRLVTEPPASSTARRPIPAKSVRRFSAGSEQGAKEEVVAGVLDAVAVQVLPPAAATVPQPATIGSSVFGRFHTLQLSSGED
jgi:hypothetical protein